MQDYDVDDEKVDTVAVLAYRDLCDSGFDTASSHAGSTMAFIPAANGTVSKHEAGRFLRRPPC